MVPRKWFQSHSPKSAVPPGIRVYAIGDVHGRLDLLEGVFAKIDNDLARRPTVASMTIMIGDYVDRGPNTKGVIDLLLKRAQMDRLICLRGNHEQLFLNFLFNPSSFGGWRSVGAMETLTSYGLKVNPDENPARLARKLNGALPASHRRFLDALPLTYTLGDYFFVHAGVQPGISLDDQDPADLLWIRGEFLEYQSSFGKIVVHGHTPVAAPDIRHNRVNIDTGAYITNRLTCLVLEGESIFTIT